MLTIYKIVYFNPSLSKDKHDDAMHLYNLCHKTINNQSLNASGSTY